MGKTPIDEQKRQWQWRTNNIETSITGTTCPEVTFCPCQAYARASGRLRAALNNTDALNLPDSGFVTADCLQFAFCCPFYGCFIAKLQTTVRSLYDIKGNDVNDWAKGCCCPCRTILRNESEIIVRETVLTDVKTVRGSDIVSKHNIGYKGQPPMSFTSNRTAKSTKNTTRPKSKSSRQSNNGSEFELDALSPIAETKCEPFASSALPTKDKKQSGRGKNKESQKQSTPHVVSPPPTTRPPLKSSSSLSAGPNSIHDDDTVSASPGLSHSIRDDEVATVGTSSPHLIHDDLVAPISTNRRHSIHEDVIVPVSRDKNQGWPILQYLGDMWYLVPAKGKENRKENTKPSSDELSETKTIREEAVLAGHEHDHEPASGSAKSQGLPQTSVTISITGPSPTHSLEQDEPVIPMKIDSRHSLDQDERYATTIISRYAAHGLEHDKSESKKARFKEHILEDDPPITVKDTSGTYFNEAGSPPYGVSTSEPQVERSVNQAQPEGATPVEAGEGPGSAKSHHLDDDTTIPVGGQEKAAGHSLEEGDVTTAAAAQVATHRLSDD